MSKDPLADSVAFHVRRGWVTGVVLLLLLGTVLVALLRYDAFRKANGTPTIATVTAVYTLDWDNVYEPGAVTVVARSDNGVTGSRTVTLDRVKPCKVGRRITASQVGAGLRLDPWPCGGQPRR
jgi:hypothetical protein